MAQRGAATTKVAQPSSGNRFTRLSKGLVRERGKMNKTETAYAEWLKARVVTGEIVDWWFEPLSLRLSHPDQGQPARFSPDFMVLYPDGTTCFDDTKGKMTDFAAMVRIKAAAELYPLWRFRVATKVKGGFDVVEV